MKRAKAAPHAPERRPRSSRSKRDLEVLMRLQKKYGDIKLSEVIRKQTKLRPGRPREWDLKALCELRVSIDIFMLNGVSKGITAACRDYAGLHKLNPKVVEKRYHETIPRLRERYPGQTDEELSRYPFTISFLGVPYDEVRDYEEKRLSSHEDDDEDGDDEDDKDDKDDKDE
jgi:hypothetical protein